MAGKCECPGFFYYEKWQHWRVISRGAKTSRLYCLKCRHSWLTRARYVAIMRDHKPRRRSGMTDENILQRIMNGSLVVDVENAIVESLSVIGRKLLRVIERESNGSSYRFVEVSYQGKKKKIALHRLVWIAANQKIPPKGYDVDHNDGPFDGISNLRLRLSGENRSDTAKQRKLADVPF